MVHLRELQAFGAIVEKRGVEMARDGDTHQSLTDDEVALVVRVFVAANAAGIDSDVHVDVYGMLARYERAFALRKATSETIRATEPMQSDKLYPIDFEPYRKANEAATKVLVQAMRALAVNIIRASCEETERWAKDMGGAPQ